MEMTVSANDDVALARALRKFHDDSVGIYRRERGGIAQTDVRYVAADNALMSQFNGRVSATMSTGMLGNYNSRTLPDADQANYFLIGLQNVAAAYNGRPHPGKVHYMGAADLKRVYPNTYCTFVSLVSYVDSAGMFMTPYLSGLFSDSICSDAEMNIGDFHIAYAQAPLPSAEPTPDPTVKPGASSNPTHTATGVPNMRAPSRAPRDSTETGSSGSGKSLPGWVPSSPATIGIAVGAGVAGLVVIAVVVIYFKNVAKATASAITEPRRPAQDHGPHVVQQQNSTQFYRPPTAVGAIPGARTAGTAVAIGNGAAVTAVASPQMRRRPGSTRNAQRENDQFHV
jgi:hypothetical protein